MKSLTIFAAIVSVASAQYRQFRTTDQDAAEPVDSSAPSKFEGLVNVTWSPEWTISGPLNFSELQDSVEEKFDVFGQLASLAGPQVMSGLNLISNLFSNASVSALVTAVNGYAGYTITTTYNLVSTVIYPATVTVILFAGVFYIIQVAIQVLHVFSYSQFYVFVNISAKNIKLHFTQKIYVGTGTSSSKSPTLLQELREG
jgi:hypothetical protein